MPNSFTVPSKDAVLLWMHDPAGRDAEVIRKKLVVDQNLEAATEVICSRTASKIQYLRQILLAYVTIPCYGGPEVSREMAEKDAKALYKAGDKRFGTDEKTFVEIFSERSRPQLNAINSCYHELYGHSLKKEIKKETSGDFCSDLLTIVRCAENPGKFAELKMHRMRSFFLCSPEARNQFSRLMLLCCLDFSPWSPTLLSWQASFIFIGGRQVGGVYADE